MKRGDITLEEAEQALDDFQRRLQAALDETRDRTRRRRGASAKPPPPPVGVLPHVETGVDRATLDRIYAALSHRARGLHTSTRSWPSSSRPATQDVRATARSTGRSPRRWRSARCCSRAPTSASPARTPGGARSASATPVLVDYDDRRRVRAARRPRRRPGASSGSTTRCCRSTPRSASSTATRSCTRTRSWSGRRSSATSSTAPRSSSTSSSSPPRTSGARRRASCCCSRTATRARAPSTRRPASSGSSRCAPRTTSRSCNATTPAQYFHLLRRQMRREVRKPLVVFTPKSLLRAKHGPLADRRAHRRARSEEVLDDPGVTDPAAVRRVVFCSGKVATTRSPRRDERRRAGRGRARRAALPVARTSSSPRSLRRYPNADEVVWLQEEPENMGPWRFVYDRRHEIDERGLQDPPGVPRRVGQPGDRLGRHPRPRAQRPARRVLRRPVGRSVRPTGSRRPLRARRGLAAGSSTLIVVMPIAARRLEVDAEVVEEHAASSGFDVEQLAGHLVEARVGLAHADLARLDDDVEERHHLGHLRLAIDMTGCGDEVVGEAAVFSRSRAAADAPRPSRDGARRRAALEHVAARRRVAGRGGLGLEQRRRTRRSRPRCARVAPRRSCRGSSR